MWKQTNRKVNLAALFTWFVPTVTPSFPFDSGKKEVYCQSLSIGARPSLLIQKSPPCYFIFNRFSKPEGSTVCRDVENE
jgi:hypothetical protein